MEKPWLIFVDLIIKMSRCKRQGNFIMAGKRTQPFINKMLPVPAIPLLTAVCACGLYPVMALPGMIRVFLFEKLGGSRIMQAGAEKVDERIYLE